MMFQTDDLLSIPYLSYFSTGFTFATAWVAMVEYTSAAVPEVSLGTVMGILHGVYWGLGIGCGHLIGGALIDNFGARTTFKIHIAASAVVVVLVFIVQRVCMTTTILLIRFPFITQSYGLPSDTSKINA